MVKEKRVDKTKIHRELERKRETKENNVTKDNLEK